jgi:hypothetical protein
VRRRECRADRSVPEERHPGDECAEIADDGKIDPLLGDDADEPLDAELGRRRGDGRELEAELRERIEAEKRQEAEDVEPPQAITPIPRAPPRSRSARSSRYGEA